MPKWPTVSITGTDARQVFLLNRTSNINALITFQNYLHTCVPLQLTMDICTRKINAYMYLQVLATLL